MSKLDEIVREQRAKGKKYADWQGERYPVVASHKNSKRLAEMEMSRSQMRRVEIQKGE